MNIIHFPLGRTRPGPLHTWIDERQRRLRRERRRELAMGLIGALMWFAAAWLMLLIL